MNYSKKQERMIHRTKIFTKVPSSLSSADCLASLEAIVNAPSKDRSKLIKSKFYNNNEVHKALRNIYGKKCAYCESPEDEPEIEHYRPKGRLTGRVHSGYYWLCYEWSNLLPSCHDCNKSGAKGNLFPILGKPAAIIKNGSLPDPKENLLTSNNLLIQEMPLLLNPETPGFTPFDYMEFDENGFIGVKKGMKRDSNQYKMAQNTIDIYELDRYKLEIEFRKKEIRRLYMQIKLIYVQYLLEELTLNGFKKQYFTILKKIKSASDASKPYSFFWSFVFMNFNQVYITSFFKPRQRKLFFDLTNEFKNAN